MIADQGALEVEVVVFQLFLVRLAFQRVELEEQTLADVAGADARGLERVHELERGVQVVEREGRFRFLLDRFQLGAEVALGVDVVDEGLAGRADAGGRVLDERPLPEEVFLERAAAGGGVVHRVHLAIALAVVAADAMAGPEAGVRVELLVLEVLADLGQPLEVVGVVAVLADDHRLFALGELLVGLAVGRFGDGGHGAFAFELPVAELEDGIVLKFLFDPLFQRHQRELEDLHRLNHSRREQLPLLHAHRSLLS
jgi:hypothetical protein